jgi:hypothetical protein
MNTLIPIDDDFPYDLPGKQALVALIQKGLPHLDVREEYAVFGDLTHSPTSLIPGRSFVELDNQWTNIKSWLAFRRLDIAKSLGLKPKIVVQGAITARSIALEINRSRNRFLDATDVDWGNTTLSDGAKPFIYTMKILSSSYVYYGEVQIEVISSGVNPNARLLEDGTPRQLEDGSIRLLETA